MLLLLVRMQAIGSSSIRVDCVKRHVFDRHHGGLAWPPFELVQFTTRESFEGFGCCAKEVNRSVILDRIDVHLRIVNVNRKLESSDAPFRSSIREYWPIDVLSSESR